MTSAFDVLVIGAGAAGLMAAGQSAVHGASTLLVEKMDRPGRKLLITGKGRCNITNTAPLDEFIPHFGPNGRFLYSAFHRFFNTDLVEFFDTIGVASVEERGGRIFPASDDAEDVVEALVRWARAMGVTIWTGARVERLLVDDQRVMGVQLTGGNRHSARAVIVTTGGASYPGTGSTGDGYRLAQAVGHTIVPIRPALIPLDTAGNTARRLEGLSLRNVRASLWVNGKMTSSEFGEMLFTGFGLSGPIILKLSGRAVDALRAGQPVQISIDLKPALDDEQLELRLLRDFEEHRKKEFHTLLKGLLPRTLIPVCCDLVQIPADKVVHRITAPERDLLRRWLKDFRLDVIGHRPLTAAIVTAGGVDLREVDPRTMESRLVGGLYFAGEVLDLDADTGGYNLQAAFSTGWLAGHSAAS